MTVPTNIPETPMFHTKHKSLHGSKGMKHSIPMEVLQCVLKTVLGIRNDDQIDSFSHWVSYRGYHNFDYVCEHLQSISADFDKYAEYRVNGIKYYLNSNIIHKIEMFSCWMSEKMRDGIHILHDEFLTCLTREQFIEFRQGDITLMSNSRSSHVEPYTPMTTSTGHTKPTAISESQTALNNFKRGTKRDASAFPIFKNDLCFDTFQRSFLAIIKAQGLYDVADPDYDLGDGDHYEQELFQENNPLFILCWLLLFRQKRGVS